MKFWKKIKRGVAEFLYGGTINKRLIIIRSDGGICSQIAFFALGKFYEDKGYPIKYDLSWFEENGKDMNGEFDRNFDLLRAFPSINIDIASESETHHYRKHHKSSDGDLESQSPPAYLDAFYDGRWSQVIQFREYLKNNFTPDNLVFENHNNEVLQDILCQENACAVHVRRGDLGAYNEYYGEPLGVGFFLEAIGHVLRVSANTKFYFFSDESDWVRENILSSLNANVKYEIIDKNGSDKGYIDLYLMSKCKSFITSHGSLAKFARLLSSDDALIVEPKSKCMFDVELRDNVIVI
jgi:hypothetical protein